VFIQAKNAHYGFDFCPAFWDWIIDAAERTFAASLDRIRDELKDGKDELATWAHHHPELFLPPDEATVASLAVLAAAVGAARINGSPYNDAAISEFLASGDYYLIAHAHAHGHAVVTHERESDTLRKVKIPNACQLVGVSSALPWEMLRADGAKFQL
jgi:hypothetical protein